MSNAFDLRHLRYFVVVAEELNFRRAAERLFISQPPLSRQIRDLEEELGVPLFQRTARSLVLTEAGKLFLPEARAVILRAEQAVQAVRTQAKKERAHLRVGYAPSLTVELLPRVLKLFAEECADVRVSLHDLSTEECTQRLKAGKLDVALVARPAPSTRRGLSFEKVLAYSLFGAIAARHPFAFKRALWLSVFRTESLLAYSRDDYPEYHEWLHDLFRPLGFEPQIEEYDSASSLIAAVEAGRGIALVSGSMRCMAGPRMKLIPIKPALDPVVVGVLAGKRPGRWVELFIAAVKKAAPQRH